MTKTLEELKRETVSAFSAQKDRDDDDVTRLRRVTIEDVIDWLGHQGHLRTGPDTLRTENERLRNALLWAKPYVARIRDTRIIDEALMIKEDG